MIGWVAGALVLFVFLVVMAGLAREALRPLDETDEWCAQVDQDLDLVYGGWRNRHGR